MTMTIKAQGTCTKWLRIGALDLYSRTAAARFSCMPMNASARQRLVTPKMGDHLVFEVEHTRRGRRAVRVDYIFWRTRHDRASSGSEATASRRLLPRSERAARLRTLNRGALATRWISLTRFATCATSVAMVSVST